MTARTSRTAGTSTWYLFLAIAVLIGGAAPSQAQGPPEGSRAPTVSPVPQEFVGIWDWKTPRQSCGSTVDSYGQPATFDSKPGGRPLCQWPIDRLEKVLNGRGRAWRQFTRNGGDDVISPRWTCVAAGLGTVLTESYLRGFYKRADSLVMHFDQSNWFRPGLDRWPRPSARDRRPLPWTFDRLDGGHDVRRRDDQPDVGSRRLRRSLARRTLPHGEVHRAVHASRARTAWNCPLPSRTPSF